MALGVILKAGVRLKKAAQFVAAAMLFVAGAAIAQPPQVSAPPPPMPSQIDERGVDLTSGDLVMSTTDLSIGPSDHRGLTLARQWSDKAWRIANIPTMSGSTASPIVSFGGKSVPFVETVGGNYKAVFEDGSTLSNDRSTYTASDGTQITFTTGYQEYTVDSSLGIGTQVTFPDGVRWNFNYETTVATLGPGPVPPECYNYPPQAMWPICAYYIAMQQQYYMRRLSSITSSTGYQIKLEYALATATYANMASWWSITKATALNNAVEYCNPVASICTFANTWPQVSYNYWYNGTIASTTDPVGRVTNYSYNGSGGYYQLAGIQPPGASTNTVAYSYTYDKVTGATVNGGTWIYAYPSSTQTTVTDPASNVQTINYDGAHLVTSIVAGGQTTAFTYCTTSDTNCPEDLLKTVTMPEGNSVTYAYDARANLLSTTRVGKPSSGVSNIVTSATYPGSCTYIKTCNQPITTTDARGQVTDYVYDNGHGGVTSVKLPADASGVRPETRISYSNYQAYYKNSGGSIVASGVNIALPTQVSSCRTTASCSGGTDERKVVMSYGPQSAGTANNLLPAVATISRGDGALARTSSLSYDIYGNVLTTDGPLVADTSRIRYNLARQVVGKVGADPDDGGASKFPAVRYSYDSWGHAYLVETGMANGLSDSDWSAFSPTGNTLTEYDAYGRPVIQLVRDSANNSAQRVDTIYDAFSRVQCTIVRMDLNRVSTGGCDAVQAVGADVPDRSTYNTYDTLGRLSKVTSGFGTSYPADTQTLTFTNNGQVAAVKDAENNLSAYVYDGHDRRVTTYFPNQNKGSIDSNGADREEATYDPNGNVTYFRTRRGETIGYIYDNLNRLIFKDVPIRSGLSSTHTRDVYYGYDLFGGMTYARFDSNSGEGITNYFDALGQQTDSTLYMDGVSQNLTTQHDSIGNRSALIFPDGQTIAYTRYGSGAFYYAGLVGHSGVFYSTFDTQARPNNLWRLNTSISNWGNASSYGYDGLSRPSSFAHDFAGTSDDTSTTLSYNAANQITSAVRSNDAFAWTGQAALNRNYTSNGLNEYSNVGGTSYGYDGNHNLTSDGTNSYVYDVENQLVSRSGGGTTATVRYDPLGRLYEVVGSVTGTTRFLYDGDDLVAEYDGSGTLLRRYAHGEGVDQPLVQFEGSGVSDSARRYFYSDERGSIIAVTDGAGNVLNRMAYDEYGLPQESNSSYRSRFQYTGQAWIPELGMNYYKARMYSPLLGRFMQTDPIGYGDGMNMYAYVKNDPVNNADPTGLDGASFVYATCSQLAAGAATAGMNSEDFMRRHASCFGPQLYALDQQRLANEAWLRGNVQGGSPSDGFAAAAGQQTPQKNEAPKITRDCGNTPKRYPIPKGYVEAFPGNTRLIRREGSDWRKAPAINPNYQKALQKPFINKSGVFWDLATVVFGGVTGGLFGEGAAVVEAGSAAGAAGVAAGAEVSHADYCPAG